MLHFAPKHHNFSPGCELIGDDALVRIANDAGVQHILCGHLHKVESNVPSAAHNDVYLHLANAAFQQGNRNGVLSAYEINVRNGEVVGKIKAQSYRWDGNDYVLI